jgi:hypothetical protein
VDGEACQLARLRAGIYVPPVRFNDSSDPPSPLSVVRRMLGGALVVGTVILAVVYFDSGHVDGRWVTFIAALWLFWGVFSDLFGLLLQPFAALLGGQVIGGQDSGPPAQIDIERETEMLEHLVTNPPPVPHREILAGIRLAEIYRTHQHDGPKSAALLARLRAKYPEARELLHDIGP